MEIDKFIINLNNRSDRLLNSLKELKKADLHHNIHLFDAENEVTAAEYSHKYISAKAYQNILNPKNSIVLPNFKSLACANSHIKVWNIINEKNIEEALIIEDDIKIINKKLFQVELNNLLNFLKTRQHNSYLVTFNSTLSFKWGNVTHTSINLDNVYCNNIEKIKCPFIGLQFYYVNIKMIKYLLKNIGILTYQLDVSIGLLSKKDIFSSNKFYNYKTDSITEDRQFISDVQFYHIIPKNISKIFKFPIEIGTAIYQFIPSMYKLDRHQQLNDSSFNFEMSEILWFV